MGSRLGYRPALDGVRAVAVLAVIAYHYRGQDPHALPTRGGWLGVDIFFVLSGFLITSLLYEEFIERERIDLRAFYARRALRLFPALFAFVACYVAWIAAFGPHRMANAREAVATIFYFNNWYRAMLHPVTTGLSHTWSLSVEEQFYVLWPLMLILLVRWWPRAAICFTAAVAIAAPVWRVVVWRHTGGDYGRVHEGLDTRADSLLIGSMLALFLERGGLARIDRVLKLLAFPSFATVAGFLIAADSTTAFASTIGLSCFAFAVAVALYNVLQHGFGHQLLEHPAMLWIGKRSYGLYLWHWGIFYVLLAEVGHARWAALIGLPATFLAVTVSFRYVERPFLRLKARFAPRERIGSPAVLAP